MESERPILLFSEGISYCHVVRPLVIGRWLRELERPIVVACRQCHRSLFTNEGFSTVPIQTADPKAIYARLAKGKTLYTSGELLNYFRQDEALLREVDPSMVVADFRFPLLQLAKQQGIPSVGITSASCHPHFPLDGTTPNPFVNPSILPAEFFDAVQRTPVGRLMRHMLVKQLSHPYRTASRKYGMPVLPTFFDYASQGDICLLSDHPEVMPVSQTRPQDIYTGALIWDRDEELPQELRELSSGKKRVYITVGTQESMKVDFLVELIQRLLDDGLCVILSKGRRRFEVPVQHESLFVYDFVNESKLLPLIDLYIYHGSAMSTYHGLHFGVPMISIPQQADQHFHSEALLRLGVGELFRPVHLSVPKLVASAHRILDDPQSTAASRQMSSRLREFDQKSLVVERIGKLLASRATSKPHSPAATTT